MKLVRKKKELITALQPPSEREERKKERKTDKTISI